MLVRDSGGCSALHKAAQNGHTELVSYILQQGEAVHDVHGGRNATKNSLKKNRFSFPEMFKNYIFKQVYLHY